MSGPKRACRMSKNQKDLLVNRLQAEKFLLQQDKLKPAELQKFTYGWQKLADELNREPGAKKTVSQWKEAWNELKVNTKRKARLLYEEATGTGGGPKKLKDLTDLEERIMQLLAKIVLTGANEIPEAGVPSTSQNCGNASVTTMEYSPDDEFNILTQPICTFTFDAPVDDENNPSAMPGSSTTPLQHVTESASQNETPTVNRQRRRPRDISSVEQLAQDHRKCLETLAASNYALAQATLSMARSAKKKKAGLKVPH